MPWLIACFIDNSVSMVSEKWMKKKGRKCWFPNTNVAFHIKNETPVDKKSGKWALYACRILMHGAKYATLKEAKKAEKTAQNHSTMTSFEKSYDAKQVARKHPNVYDDSSASECVTADSKIIDQLTNSDRESFFPKEKKYVYHCDADAINSNNDPEQNGEDEEVEFDGSSDGDIVSDNSGNVNGLDDVVYGSDDGYDDMDAAENKDEDMGAVGDRDKYVNASDVKVYVSENHLREQPFIPDYGNNFESTSEVQCPAGNYDFSDDRCLQRIEKLVMHACQELESIKHEMKLLKIKSTETEEVVGKLVAVCKDLSVEVFTCAAELKKRNGMFADLLVPDLKLTFKRRKDFKKNESALANNKIVDNLIKYLASTINESKENKFIEGCFNAIFDTEFLTDKVWWKTEQGKILIKRTRTLHCIKESFKLKFGLVEPKKCDKTIEALIHKTVRNMKDNFRKSLKKAREAEENAAEAAPMVEKKSAKKATKKEVEALKEVKTAKKAREAEENAAEAAPMVEKKSAKKSVNEAAKKEVEALKKVKSNKKAREAEENAAVPAKMVERKAAKEAVKKEVQAKSTEMVSTEANIPVERGCINENDWDLDDYENYKKHRKAKEAAKKAAKKAAKVKLITKEPDRVPKNSGRLSVKSSREDFGVGVKSARNGRKRSSLDDFDSDGANKRKKKN